jgi:hypothetical protein
MSGGTARTAKHAIVPAKRANLAGDKSSNIGKALKEKVVGDAVDTAKNEKETRSLTAWGDGPGAGCKAMSAMS